MEPAWEINYVGNHGLAFWGSAQGNQPMINGPGSPNTRRPLAKYTTAPVTALAPWNQSTYNGFSSMLERRFGNGVSFLTSFSYGKVINLQDIGINVGSTTADTVQNAYNRRAQRVLSDISVPWHLVMSGGWDLPFGTGRQFLDHGWVGRVVGPWQLTAIYAVQAGLPYTATLSFDNANAGTASWPDRACNGKLSNANISRWFDTGCFPAPPAYQFGNSGKNILRGPGFNNIDLGLHRVFVLPLERRTTLDVRAEAFNSVNHPQFGNPSAVIGTSTAAVITSTSQTNRQMQLALRLEF